jgi:photosystem II stability/assembly factor-like uncharacterized protein
VRLVHPGERGVRRASTRPPRDATVARASHLGAITAGRFHGDTTPGQTGTVMRSKDAGKTWENLPLPVQPNTAMWVVHLQAVDPNVVFAGSRYGYLYRSDDGGERWQYLSTIVNPDAVQMAFATREH